ncbi:MAG: hypothetical protein Q8R78_03975 [Candidatus Omnitrophota bacterium]|nr:hypothetical protein [Candidatus Omnitrophota bacterium]
MRYTRWLLVIAGVAGFGCLQVAQRTAIVLKGYALGERLDRVHTQLTTMSLEQVEVEGLSSPAHLAQVERDQRMNFVAWSPVRVAALQPKTSD